MKLEIGKTYKSRSGKVYTITHFNGHTYGHSGCVAMWYESGNCLYSKQEHRDDLIEEVTETKVGNMEFLTKFGIKCFGEPGPLKVGDRVTFSDGSYSCYPTKEGFTSDHPAASGRQEKGVILAVNCKLPALYTYISCKDEQANDTIVFTDSGKTYFTRIEFLRRI